MRCYAERVGILRTFRCPRPDRVVGDDTAKNDGAEACRLGMDAGVAKGRIRLVPLVVGVA